MKLITQTPFFCLPPHGNQLIEFYFLLSPHGDQLIGITFPFFCHMVLSVVIAWKLRGILYSFQDRYCDGWCPPSTTCCLIIVLFCFVLLSFAFFDLFRFFLFCIVYVKIILTWHTWCLFVRIWHPADLGSYLSTNGCFRPQGNNWESEAQLRHDHTLRLLGLVITCSPSLESQIPPPPLSSSEAHLGWPHFRWPNS